MSKALKQRHLIIISLIIAIVVSCLSIGLAFLVGSSSSQQPKKSPSANPVISSKSTKSKSTTTVVISAPTNLPPKIQPPPKYERSYHKSDHFNETKLKSFSFEREFIIEFQSNNPSTYDEFMLALIRRNMSSVEKFTVFDEDELTPNSSKLTWIEYIFLEAKKQSFGSCKFYSWLEGSRYRPNKISNTTELEPSQLVSFGYAMAVYKKFYGSHAVKKVSLDRFMTHLFKRNGECENAKIYLNEGIRMVDNGGSIENYFDVFYKSRPQFSGYGYRDSFSAITDLSYRIIEDFDGKEFNNARSTLRTYGDSPITLQKWLTIANEWDECFEFNKEYRFILKNSNRRRRFCYHLYGLLYRDIVDKNLQTDDIFISDCDSNEFCKAARSQGSKFTSGSWESFWVSYIKERLNISDDDDKIPYAIGMSVEDYMTSIQERLNSRNNYVKNNFLSWISRRDYMTYEKLMEILMDTDETRFEVITGSKYGWGPREILDNTTYTLKTLSTKLINPKRQKMEVNIEFYLDDEHHFDKIFAQALCSASEELKQGFIYEPVYNVKIKKNFLQSHYNYETREVLFSSSGMGKFSNLLSKMDHFGISENCKNSLLSIAFFNPHSIYASERGLFKNILGDAFQSERFKDLSPLSFDDYKDLNEFNLNDSNWLKATSVN